MAKRKSLQLGSITVKDEKTQLPAVDQTGSWAAQSADKLKDAADPVAAYRKQLEDIYAQYVDREPFVYDPQTDPVYQQQAVLYQNLGHRAMRDTMGQAAALTGGYGNTYAQTAGQQAYQQYMQQLSALMPEYYQTAYQQYQDQGDALKDRYGMVSDMYQTAYGQAQDAYDRQWQEDERDYDREQDALDRQWQEDERDYNREQDTLDRQWQEDERDYDREQDTLDRQWQEDERDYDREQDALDRQWQEDERDYDREQDALDRQWQEDERDYNREQDTLDRQWQEDERDYDRAQDENDRQQSAEDTAYDRSEDAYDRLMDLIAVGYRPTDQELEAAGMTRPQADALQAHYAAQSAGGGTSGGGNSGTSAVGDPTVSDIKQMQTILGVTADGVWGPNTSAAAGNISAKTAWKRLNDPTRPWGTDRAQKYYADKGTRAQWAARGITDKEYDAMVVNWMASAGFLPAEMAWLQVQFAQ